MRVGGISETCSNIGNDIIFAFMFKKCGLKCRCVITGSVSLVLFCFMFLGDFIVHADLYDTVMG